MTPTDRKFLFDIRTNVYRAITDAVPWYIRDDFHSGFGMHEIQEQIFLESIKDLTE